MYEKITTVFVFVS